MNEKIKKIIKLINIKLIKKIILILLGLFILSFILIAIYSFTYEKDKIAIDKYNFEQLKKAKPILESIPETDKKFYNLKQFNQKYNATIQPINNCYSISNDNGNEKYIFGFKLESLIYIYIEQSYLLIHIIIKKVHHHALGTDDV
ncbi:MAG: hypothetical protein PHH98_01640 [Candidatus Gracilibacteria bacterium]|nr:hypothetical protein [Candidatus Gracilibacteria bacterium]MDD2907321.1 hypothetical protein [Candidatus Gracilibacteria bacterium]